MTNNKLIKHLQRFKNLRWSTISVTSKSIFLKKERLLETKVGSICAKRSNFHTAKINFQTDKSALETRYTPVPDLSVGHLISSYQALSKAKLAGLVTLTTMCGYAVAPGATDLITLFFTTLGTGLCISSANSINQWIEIPYDAQMARTRNRVLVKHALSPEHAFGFGISSGLAGVATLTAFVNPTVAALGAANIFLYTSIYTPMKRYSIANTWVGAVVGAIPPMMGWAACTGNLDLASWTLGLTLYAWQFPHFNSLAWNLRSDYAKAGYQMMAVTDPNLNARVSLRYALLMFPITFAFPALELTTWWFALDASILNFYMALKAYTFWSRPNDKNARSLFFSSLIHLPLFFAFMMLHKAQDEEKKAEEIEI